MDNQKEKIREKIRNAQFERHNKAIKNGKFLGKPATGYKNYFNQHGATIIHDPIMAPIVKNIFELFATGGYSLVKISELIFKKNDIYISTSTISKILNNHFYYGRMKYNNELFDHIYPPIISKELFDKVSELLKKSQTRKFIYAGLPYLYRSLIQCDECGRTISPEKHKGHIYYHCTLSYGSEIRNIPKHGKWIKEHEISEQILDIFSKMKTNANLLIPNIKFSPHNQLIVDNILILLNKSEEIIKSKNLLHVRILIKFVFDQLKLYNKDINKYPKEPFATFLIYCDPTGIDSLDFSFTLDEIKFLLNELMPKKDKQVKSIDSTLPISENIFRLCIIPTTIDELIEKLDISISEIQNILFDLELNGNIVNDNGYYKTI